MTFSTKKQTAEPISAADLSMRFHHARVRSQICCEVLSFSHFGIFEEILIISRALTPGNFFRVEIYGIFRANLGSWAQNVAEEGPQKFCLKNLHLF